MKEFNFTRYQFPALIVSGLFILGFWVYTFVVVGGFNLGIDFQAGLDMAVDVPAASEEAIREALTDYNPQVQTIGDDGTRFNIRIADDTDTDNFQQTTSKAVSDILEERFEKVDITNEEYIGSSFAGSLATQTIWVTLIALGLILLYVWIRFKLNYAVSAIVAVFHDVLFLLGFIGAFGLEFSTSTIAAVLTIIGYSLNDTIVIFDRIRENSRIVKDRSFGEIINRSVSQSLSRTLITSVTTLLAVIAIYIFATGTIRIFALSLVVGVLVGTYSSIFVASPILLAWHNRKSRKAKAHAKPIPVVVSDTSNSVSSRSNRTQIPESPKQTAQEILEATERRKARTKAKKRKKKK